MRTETNLEGIKSVAKNFLYIDVKGQDSEFWPLIVQHPIFSSSMVYGKKRFYDITKQEDLKEAREEYCKVIDTMRKISELIHFVNKPYRMAFLKYAMEDMSVKDFSENLKYIWTTTENPNQDVNVSVSTAAKWFREADKHFLMNKKEQEVYANLSESITLYRGVAVGRNPKGLSWTNDIKTARWFAHRFDRNGKAGYIQYATVPKLKVLAYFDGEKEFVAQVKNFSILEES